MFLKSFNLQSKPLLWGFFSSSFQTFFSDDTNPWTMCFKVLWTKGTMGIDSPSISRTASFVLKPLPFSFSCFHRASSHLDGRCYVAMAKDVSQGWRMVLPGHLDLSLRISVLLVVKSTRRRFDMILTPINLVIGWGLMGLNPPATFKALRSKSRVAAEALVKHYIIILRSGLDRTRSNK